MICASRNGQQRFVALLIACAAAACEDGISMTPSGADGEHTHEDGEAHAHGAEATAGAPAHAHEGEEDHVHGNASAEVASADELVPPPGTVIGDFNWQLPKGWRLPVIPLDNPMSTAKVALGRRLFYDKRLSDNQTQSCASCHKQELAFTDARATGLGSTEQAHPRGPMALINLAYTASLTWSSKKFGMGIVDTPLEDQAAVPLFGTDPVELGARQAELEERLRSVPEYKQWFAEAFPDQAEPIVARNVQRALATFERVLVSGNSAYDRYLAGDTSALTEQQVRGHLLFNDEKFECFHCHSQFTLSDHVHWQGKSKLELRYHNNGIYNIDGKGAFPEPNTGVYAESKDPKDMGMFKVPTLRNIAVTAPYMHDGSIATLSEVLDHYAAGGRTIKTGPNAGDGSKSPLKNRFVRKFDMTEDERNDVIAFLESLTDDEFLTNPAFADPWQ